MVRSMLWTITVLKNYFSSHHQLTSLRKEVPLNLNTLRLWHHGTFSWLEFIDNRKESDLQNIDLNKTQKLLKVVHRVKKKINGANDCQRQNSFVNKRSKNVSNGTTTLKSVRD